MTNPLRIVVLAALAAFMMSSVPANSAPPRPPCEDARDCPVGDICVKKKSSDKTGFCRASPAKKVQKPTSTPSQPPSSSYWSPPAPCRIKLSCAVYGERGGRRGSAAQRSSRGWLSGAL